MGAGRQLLRGDQGDATKTTSKMVFDGDWGCSALTHAANLKGFTASVTGDLLFGGDKGGAAGTLQVENPLDVALDNDLRGHIAPRPG